MTIGVLGFCLKKGATFLFDKLSLVISRLLTCFSQTRAAFTEAYTALLIKFQSQAFESTVTVKVPPCTEKPSSNFT